MADTDETAAGGSRVVPDDVPADEFDASSMKKKKKKKKKVPAEFLEEGEAPAATEETGKEETPAPAADVDNPYAIVDDELLAKKKKKKKKVVVDGDAEAAPEAGAEGDDLMLKKKKKKKKVLLEEEGEEEEDVDAGLDQQFEKKKKKKKKKKPAEEAPAAVSEDGPKAEDSLPWAGSDRDYTYQEMLTRVQRILQERNPSLAAGERRRFLMKPPKVVREGTKKTVFLNFAEICKIMNRDLQHVYQFILVELGTSGSIDGSQRMVIKGRFQPKAIENILRRYVVEYLTCHSCKSPDTILKKDDRLFFLVCNQCGAQRSVATIKQGFQAQIGKRKKM